ncbi:SusC/RagA family TonB-linked outer membrane protein [Parabacteroides distasonis]|uniref:SusC/RagA family TonB-linked outer membrane protein n=1 Tax=Parabacteroides distasonis TaxID=823 RepID=UPI0039B6487C
MQTEISYAQSLKLSFNEKEIPLGQIINAIEKQSNFLFVYTKDIDVHKKYQVDTWESSIQSILTQLFEGTNIHYEMDGNYIVLSISKPKETTTGTLQKKKTITGKILSASGEPIIGANVIEKGTTNGTVTNLDGEFTLSLDPSSTLQVSYIGYQILERRLNNASFYSIKLVEDSQALEEVVVVGYGVVQKKDLTGSVAQIQSDDLQDLAVPRIDQALSGKMAGVQVISTTGEPGAAPLIRVRGVGSISAGMEPLYVIDGFPGDDISMINPSDIETIDILKDASATAIYGSRGANGVVLITTKRGKEGKARISLNAYYGWQKVLRTPKFLSKEEQAQYYYEGIKNQNLDAGYDVSGDPRKDWNYAVPQTVMDVLNGTNPYNTDAYDEIFQTAPQQSYNLSVQGGNEKIKYAVSGEYTSQEGIIVTNKFQRFSARANLDAKLSDRVSMKFNMNSTYSNGRNILASGGAAESEGILGAATTWLKWYPLYNEDGSYFSGFGQDATNNVWNPLAQAYEIKRKNEQYRTLANLEMDIKIIEGLNFKAMLGANVVNRHKYSFIPKLDVFSNSSDGTDERSDRLNWITEWTMNYQKSFKKHNLSALVGYTTQKETNKSNYLRSMSYPNNLVYTLNAVSNDIYAGNSDENEWSLISYLARVNYNYDSKYYITASIRADGSSRFGKSNKYGYFPSVALAWRASEEDFLKSVEAITNLKLRASYGETGNNNIGNYAHIATIDYESYVLADKGVGGFAPANIENALLTWEKQRAFNVGLDVSVFNSRVNLTADYFITRNHNLLLNVYVPQITGFNTSLQNIGEVENRGWELTLSTLN